MGLIGENAKKRAAEAALMEFSNYLDDGLNQQRGRRPFL